MKIFILMFVVVSFSDSAFAIPIPGKDFNECVNQADQRYSESRQFCYDNNPPGHERHACMLTADRHRQDREDNCKAVEVIHESLNPNLRVNVGFGGSSKPSSAPNPPAPAAPQLAPQDEVSPFDQPQPGHGGVMHQPSQVPSHHQNANSGFLDFVNKVLRK
jgi:hypothetical protein